MCGISYFCDQPGIIKVELLVYLISHISSI